MADEKNVHTPDTGYGVISKIKIPKDINGGTSDLIYEIHDAKAIHSAADLGLGAALRYLGTKATKNDLPTSGNKNGDVWHVTEDDYEYVWNGTEWEELGAPHDFVGTTEFDKHTHSFNAPSVTVPALTGTGTIDKYKATTTKLKATAEAPTISAGGTTASVLKSGATTTINATTSVSPTAGTQSRGTAASWTATVSDGILTFGWTANTPSSVQTSVLTGVSANNENVEVKFGSAYAQNINTSWTASAPKVTLSSSTTGDITVATGLTTDGTSSISVTTASTAATVSGGSVGTPK